MQSLEHPHPLPTPILLPCCWQEMGTCDNLLEGEERTRAGVQLLSKCSAVTQRADGTVLHTLLNTNGKMLLINAASGLVSISS